MAKACRLGNKERSVVTNNNPDENFCIFNLLCVFISLVTILADLTTDILVFAEYCQDGYVYWALQTLIFIVTPNILINIFSIRWYSNDQNLTARNWITHGLLIGFLERYILIMQKGFDCQKNEVINAQKITSQRNDLCLLHFLYIFTGTLPQIILQSYAIITLEENYYTKVFALTASITSVIWGCTTYICSIMVFSNEKFQLISLVLQITWHFSMLIARIWGILLFAVIFGIWTLIPLGVHWIAMTIWIIIQNTTFCPNKMEETLYNVVMGFVYCFCYINLINGHTRYRLLMFYTLMITQNFGSLFLYVIIYKSELQRSSWSIIATVSLILGTVLGISSMILYYRFFHSKGPIPWTYAQKNIELNNKFTIQNAQNNEKNNRLKPIRSFKSTQKNQIRVVERRIENPNTETTGLNKVEKLDQKIFMDYWITRSGTPTFASAITDDSSMNVSSIEMYTVENTPQPYLPPKPSKKTFCSPTELTLKLTSLNNIESSIDTITFSNLNLQKRRGICSSDELKDDLIDMNISSCNGMDDITKKLKFNLGPELEKNIKESNKKSGSDSIDIDLDLSLSDINSSDINNFNENIVQKLCLSALKNIKVGNQEADIDNIQRIAVDILKEMYNKKNRKTGSNGSQSSKQRDLDTPTEILSVHDYENICAVNIAREAWGLRSWNGYFDIENWLHDGSVVRDRRRDTLTSASTEISSCISQELKNAISSAPPFPKKAPTYSNVFVKFDKSNSEDYINATANANDETFLAKPCFIESGKDSNLLEPIMEELDDLDLCTKKRLNSESSLVATIDEIRKTTIANSPRNVYHRTQLWDSPQTNSNSKIENSLKRALWKEPFKFDSSNIMESVTEKENVLSASSSKIDFNKVNLTLTSDLGNISIHSKSPKRTKSNVHYVKTKNKRNQQKTEQNPHDLSNKDIDFLWRLVTDNSLPFSSTESLCANRRTSSLQSLIYQDRQTSFLNASTSTKTLNTKKGSKHRPRRKFSMLREKFEPKMNTNSDEEILYYTSKNTLTHKRKESKVLNVKNQFEVLSKESYKHTHLQLTSNELNASRCKAAMHDLDFVFAKNMK